ncbi:hypothetical protein E8D34_15490 [Nocardioides sp. GY 10113]|uniref:flagellar biosynthetic protein FliO n=1 Tax=Nocardioides sp. GY 10113 TaxID=2569761 RepID=UPI0010A88F8D|nr:flagellar biosynthetic protein FliO [Nocardioides sp. GY 10113]TIC83534.1 hypothetical protein E8D34_15490 [Nocardioides sp. GY 10113]
MLDGAPGMAELAFRLIGSLALVVGLLLLIARLVNRRFTAAAGAPVQVVARQQITRSTGVAVVTVGGRVLVVGTTDNQVSLLAELEPDELLDADGLAAADAGAGAAPLARAAAGTTGGAAAGPLSGSLLSPQTWKQTLAHFGGAGASRSESADRADRADRADVA